MKKKSRPAQPAIVIFCKFDRIADAGDLKPHPDNSHRTHPDKQLDRYEAVIRGNGWRKPVVVSKRSGFIVKGHGAWLTAKRAGWQIPVEDQDYASLAEERRDLIADNRLALGAVNDEQKLAQLLSKMDAPDVELAGYDPGEIDKLLADLNPNTVDAEPQIDKAAELQKKWNTKRGQIWELGAHRLMCGDVTNSESVKALRKKDSIDLLFCDPPYNVGKDYAGEGLSRDGFTKFHHSWLSNVISEAPKDAAAYVCSGVKWLFEMSDALRAFIKGPRLLIWYKPDSHGVGSGDFFFNYEAIFYGTTSGKFKTRSYNGEARDVWIINKAKPSAGGFEHPTVKPVEIPAAAIRTSSKTGEHVFDFFNGSGSTLIACEQLGRRCRAMEIDPGYVAVAIQRWVDATGGTPKLLK